MSPGFLYYAFTIGELHVGHWLQHGRFTTCIIYATANAIQLNQDPRPTCTSQAVVDATHMHSPLHSPCR